MEKLLLLVQWMVVLFIASSAGDFYMVVEYDTNGTARPTSLAVSISTVELYVTVLGCDHGYYSVVVDETTTTTTTTAAVSLLPPPPPPILVCKECICIDFTEGREEAFVEYVG